MKNKYILAWLAGCLWITGVAKAQSVIRPVTHYDMPGRFSVQANGTTLPVAGYKDVEYAAFQQQGPLQFTVHSSDSIAAFTISPLSKNIAGRKTDAHTLQFTLPEPAYTVVTINKTQRLFLFGDPVLNPVTTPYISVLDYKADATGKQLSTGAIQKAIAAASRSGKTLIFPPGIYRSGRLTIPSNTHIRMEAGALLKAADDLADLQLPAQQKPRGFIHIENAENVSITGAGTIDGNGRLLRTRFGDEARIRLLLIQSSRNVVISGIIQRDPGSWNTQILHSGLVRFSRVKQLNDAALPNTDGFDPDASTQVTIENCFGYCGDDNVAIKITREQAHQNRTADIIVRNCVFLTRKSSLKVGTESRGALIENILFENNDVLLSDRGMALYCSDGATYQHITYRNNRFEENYPDAKRMGFQFVINKRMPQSNAGIIKNVLLENNHFYTTFPHPSEVKGLDNHHRVEVQIKGLTIAKQKITQLNGIVVATDAAVSIE
ncbi:glycosyl hydrolase family 28 protein [Niabella sp.]|uniref:glycoside hydrolase family 28 protein n=1 Tax=Niabella sp. TaxID=1962976 RepID=UPI0026096265|nr:glycosyl hydrolase family 28 protein [Niabella sp.]